MTQPDIYTIEARRRSAAEHGKAGDYGQLVARILRGDYDTDPDQVALAATLRELNWQPPVDSDLEEARRVAADWFEACNNPTVVRDVLNGKWDDESKVVVALAAIKRGRELERGL